MLDIRITSFLVYTIFTFILMQSTLAFILNAINPSIDSSKVYVIKDLLVVSLVMLILLTRTRYDLNSLDKYVLTLILVVCALMPIYSSNVWESVSAIRFYTMPLVMYLLGRFVVQLKDDRAVEKLILFISVGFVILSLVYVFVDRDALLTLHVADFFQDKYKLFGRSDSIKNGFPVNFYFHSSDGFMMKRSFGVLFDPLATAFFGVTILFFCYEIYKRKKKAIYLVLSFSILLVICLSFTRAILLMIPVILLLYGIKNNRVRITPISPILVLMILAIIILTQNLESIRAFLDPSTFAHLSVYRFDNMLSLVSGKVDENNVRGSESLYLTIIKDYGVLFFSLYIVLFVKIYRYLVSTKKQFFSYALLASFVVYVMASFTTEHWFALSSSSLFWFLLGRNVKSNKGTALESTKKNQQYLYKKGKVVRASMY